MRYSMSVCVCAIELVCVSRLVKGFLPLAVVLLEEGTHTCRVRVVPIERFG